MPHFGRRTLYLYGQGVMFVLLIIIGGLGVPAISTSTGWATGALLLVLTFSYGTLITAVTWQMEIDSNNRYHGRPSVLLPRS